MQLEENLHEMQLELESLVWDRKKLEDHLQAAIRERKFMESMFEELEDEHDKAIEKIELLEREVNIKSSTNSQNWYRWLMWLLSVNQRPRSWNFELSYSFLNSIVQDNGS